MANEEHLEILGHGVRALNIWREENPGVRIDLEGANLEGVSLGEVNLGKADLRGTNFGRTDFTRANLAKANLEGAYLGRANLNGANLRRANLVRCYLRAASLKSTDLRRSKLGRAYIEDANLEAANLLQASLVRSNLVRANLEGANLAQANLGQANLAGAYLADAVLKDARLIETVLSNVNLSTTKGLSTCTHSGPSAIDHRTIVKSKDVPLVFWRGCGLPDALIDYMPSLACDPIQFYSCFISYSSKDQEFADRLHADLQNAGVRCWFAPHDLPIGAKTWDGIDEAIRTRDKVLLILSESAIASDWVEDEVTTAFAEERRRKELVLFPVRLDDSVIDSDEPWAGKLRDNRNIGDFTRWKNHDAYKATLERIFRDLKSKP